MPAVQDPDDHLLAAVAAFDVEMAPAFDAGLERNGVLLHVRAE
jgi:hypothetical protein